MKILIVGEYYSTNLGDGVICQTVEYLLKNILQKYKLQEVLVEHLDISMKEGYANSLQRKSKVTLLEKGEKFLLKFIYKISSHNRNVKLFMRYRNLSKLIVEQCKSRDVDIVIFAGGQLLMDYFALPIYKIIKEYSKKNTIVFFNACGFYTKNSKYYNLILERSINNSVVKGISVRDCYDLCREKLSVNSVNFSQVADPAVCCAQAFNIEKSRTSETVGLGVMFLPGKNNVILEFWKKIIIKLNNEGRQWQIFCNGNQYDYEFGINLLNSLGISDCKIKHKIAPMPTNPRELISIIAQYKSIISFRLHSHIIAYSLDIPSIGLVWDDKVLEFGKTINHPERFVNLDDIDVTKVINQLIYAELQMIDNVCKRNLQKSAENGLESIVRYLTDRK